jgi:putative holliday junction resolvase
VAILPNLQANSRKAAIDKLLLLIKNYDIKIILIGRPEARSNYSQAVIQRAEGLSSALEELALDIKIIFVDESYSSRRAAKALVERGVPKKKRQEKLDGASAAILVEDFLQKNI